MRKMASHLEGAARLAANCSSSHKNITLIVRPGGISIMGFVRAKGLSKKSEHFVGWEYIDCPRLIETVREVDRLLTEAWRLMLTGRNI